MHEKIYVLVNLNDFEIKPLFNSYDKDKVILKVGESALLGDLTDGYRILEINLSEVKE